MRRKIRKWVVQQYKVRHMVVLLSVQFCRQITELIGFVPDQHPPKCRKIFFKSVP